MQENVKNTVLKLSKRQKEGKYQEYLPDEDWAFSRRDIMLGAVESQLNKEMMRELGEREFPNYLSHPL